MPCPPLFDPQQPEIKPLTRTRTAVTVTVPVRPPRGDRRSESAARAASLPSGSLSLGHDAGSMMTVTATARRVGLEILAIDSRRSLASKLETAGSHDNGGAL